MMNSSILLTVFLALVLLQPRDDARPNFFPPTPIAELNTPCREKGPWISCDGLRLYFTSDRPECAPTERAMNIWRASRRSVEDEFGSPEVVMIDGGDPSLSADELTLFFVRVAAGPLRRNLDLFVSQRPSTDAAFGNPSPVLGPNSPFDEVGPSVSADGRRLYFASNRPGGLGEYDLWCCERASDVDPFGAPRNLVELNSSGEEANPTVAADELSLCFASDRPGSRGMDLSPISTSRVETCRRRRRTLDRSPCVSTARNRPRSRFRRCGLPCETSRRAIRCRGRRACSWIRTSFDRATCRSGNTSASTWASSIRIAPIGRPPNPRSCTKKLRSSRSSSPMRRAWPRRIQRDFGFGRSASSRRHRCASG
ncbi:MAG: PD40 domain-containing protein [Planctomycetes bacterium]|nr:PD40 domain-containing protein [Planctomycetota bacterium]